MLRQHQSLQPDQSLRFQSSQHFLQTLTYNDLAMRFYSKSIEIIVHPPVSDCSHMLVQQKDLLDDLLSYGLSKQKLTILKVISDSDHILVIMQAEESFYIGFIFLPELKVYDLKMIFSSILPIADSRIAKLSTINIVASMIKPTAANQTVGRVDIVGYQSNSFQIYFVRLQMGGTLMLFMQILKELFYHDNYPKQNEQPIIKALFIKQSNKFLIFLYQKMYNCVVKEKQDKRLSIEHEQRKNMNVKVLMQQVSKKNSETSMLMDVCQIARICVFLIRTNSFATYQSSQYFFTILFAQSSSFQGNFTFSLQNYNKQQKCKLTVFQQKQKKILIGITSGKQWRGLKYIEKDKKYVFGGRSTCILQKISLMNDNLAIIGRQGIDLVPLKQLITFPNQDRALGSSIVTNANPKNNQPATQNSKIGGRLVISSSNQQIPQQRPPAVGIKYIGSTQQRQNQQKIENKISSQSRKNKNPNKNLNYLRDNNNRLAIQKLEGVRQMDSEDQAQVPSTSNNQPFINSGISSVIGCFFQQQFNNISRDNPQGPFPSFSFGPQQIINENQMQPANVRPVQSLQNNSFSFSSKQINLYNSSSAQNPLNVLEIHERGNSNQPYRRQVSYPINNLANNTFSLATGEGANQNIPSVNTVSVTKTQVHRASKEDKSFKLRPPNPSTVMQQQQFLEHAAARKRSNRQNQMLLNLLQKIEKSSENCQKASNKISHELATLQNKTESYLKQQVFCQVRNEQQTLNKFIQHLNIIVNQQQHKKIPDCNVQEQYKKTKQLYYEKMQESRLKLLGHFKSLGLVEKPKFLNKNSSIKKPNKMQQPNKLDMKQIIQKKLVQAKLRIANLSYEWQQFEQVTTHQIHSLIQESKAIKMKRQWKHAINHNVEHLNKNGQILRRLRQSKEQRRKQRYVPVFDSDFEEIDRAPLLLLNRLI